MAKGQFCVENNRRDETNFVSGLPINDAAKKRDNLIDKYKYKHKPEIRKTWLLW